MVSPMRGLVLTLIVFAGPAALSAQEKKPGVARKAAGKAGEEMINFITSNAFQKDNPTVRTMLKKHIRDEAVKRGVKLFTNDQRTEQLLDFAFAAGSRWNILWEALTNATPLADEKEEEAFMRKRGACMEILPYLREWERKVLANVEQLQKKKDAFVTEAKELDSQAEPLQSARERGQQKNLALIAEGEDLTRAAAQVEASSNAERTALNNEIAVINNLLKDYNTRVDNELAFLKTR